MLNFLALMYDIFNINFLHFIWGFVGLFFHILLLKHIWLGFSTLLLGESINNHILDIAQLGVLYNYHDQLIQTLSFVAGALLFLALFYKMIKYKLLTFKRNKKTTSNETYIVK